MRGSRTLAVLLAGSASLFAQSFNFRPGVTYSAGSGPVATATGDFNSDGKLDIAVANVASSNISIYLGNGDGSFTPGTSVSLLSMPSSRPAAPAYTRSPSSRRRQSPPA